MFTGCPRKATRLQENNKKTKLTDKFGFTIFELLILRLTFMYITIQNRLQTMKFMAWSSTVL